MAATVTAHVVTDADGRSLDFDRRYADVLGYPRAELLGLTLQEVTHPGDLGLNTVLLRRLLADDEPFAIRKRYLRADGTPVWVENHVSMLAGAAPGGAARRLCAACTPVSAPLHPLDEHLARIQALHDASEKLCERGRRLRERWAWRPQ